MSDEPSAAQTERADRRARMAAREDMEQPLGNDDQGASLAMNCKQLPPDSDVEQVGLFSGVRSSNHFRENLKRWAFRGLVFLLSVVTVFAVLGRLRDRASPREQQGPQVVENDVSTPQVGISNEATPLPLPVNPDDIVLPPADEPVEIKVDGPLIPQTPGQQSPPLLEWQDRSEWADDTWLDMPLSDCPPKRKWKWYEVPVGRSNAMPKGRPGSPRPDQCFDMNMFYIKGSKTGSSTLSGVARRIASRYGINCAGCVRIRSLGAKEPRISASHVGNKGIRQFHNSSRMPIFEWAFVRDPVERCLSHFYHVEVSVGNKKATWANMKSFAASAHCHNFLWDYYAIDDRQAGVLKSMDFIGVSERFQESLVILGHQLGLAPGDLLYTKAKTSNTTFNRGEKELTLVAHVPLQQQPEHIQKFFREDFRMYNAKDYELFRATNERLDLAIGAIGAERFASQLEYFEKHLKTAQETCGQERNDCFHQDNGCNRQCLNDYATEHNLWEPFLDMD